MPVESPLLYIRSAIGGSICWQEVLCPTVLSLGKLRHFTENSFRLIRLRAIHHGKLAFSYPRINAICHNVPLAFTVSVGIHRLIWFISSIICMFVCLCLLLSRYPEYIGQLKRCQSQGSTCLINRSYIRHTKRISSHSLRFFRITKCD